MTTPSDLTRSLDDWLDKQAGSAMPDYLDEVLAQTQATTQRRPPRTAARLARLPVTSHTGRLIAALRRPTMQTSFNGTARSSALPLVAALGLIVVVSTALLLGGGPGFGTGVQPPIPSPTATPTQASTQPTEAPTTAATGPIDTASWKTYVSERYGFSIGHPADWTEAPSQRDWTLEADADDWLSPAADAFYGPNIRASAWSVAVDRRTTPETPAGVEAWVETYCRQAASDGCAAIGDRSVPLCLERRDCHPGLLVPFEDDVQAFFTSGDRMVVVAVWWGESRPAVAPYGGSRRLLEAFLSTMCVWPEDARPSFNLPDGC